MENGLNPRLFNSWKMTVLIAVLFLAALGIRILDLADLPNDFYLPLHCPSLLNARGDGYLIYNLRP
jgi:hypothetical protein